MEQFFLWETLASFAGSTAATAMVTQFFKDWIKLPTQILSYLIAVAILCCATGATVESPGWQIWALIPLNAIVVSLAANGCYQAVRRASGDNKK